MKITIKKLYRKCIDLRDYNIKKCIQENQNYIVTFQGDIMILSPSDLQTKCVNKQLVSPTKGQVPYELWSYEWKPN